MQKQNIAYSLCGLPYYIEGSVDKIEKLIIKTPKDFIEQGIQVFTKHTASEIYPEKNCILINGNHIFYDELILALGAKVEIPQIKNSDAKNIFTLRTLEDGIKIKEKMLISNSVLILGAGYVGIELTEAFVKHGLNVKLVEINERIAHDFDEDFSKVIQKIIANKCQNKLETYYGEKVVEFNTDENGGFRSAVTESGNEIFADFCVMAIGAKPCVEIAKNSGITLGTTGSIDVDNRMRTNITNIFACGDCAQKYSVITRQPTYIGLGTIANKEGRVAAINATSQEHYETFDGILKSTITRFFDYTISKTGLTMDEAVCNSNNINLEPVSATVVKKDKAGYMPGANEITLKLIADKRSGELLGAQSVGTGANVAQRINTITSALQSRLGVDDILHLDLPYAPPFSGSIDPVLTAAYKLKDIINK